MTDIVERLRQQWDGDDTLCEEAADEIERLRNTVVAADREIKASHADADRYRAEIVRLQAMLNEKTVEADNAAALKASDVRTTGGDASLSSTPTEKKPPGVSRRISHE